MILKPAALLAAIVALTFVGSVFAADPVNIEIMAVEEEPGRMILTVSAVDENGKPFPGLDPSSFNAWINDTALIVKELHTQTDRQPASVLLLLDVSGSMAGESIQQAQVAINEFIDVLEPNDEVAVMTFSSGVNLVQDFTADRAALEAAISGLTLTNDTNLYEGVIQAATKMTEIERSRKLIVLLSDGLANINQGARQASIDAARNAGVSFISVSLGANTDRQYLAELTTASGGNLIEAATPAELRQAYTNLAFAIRSQYTLVTEVPRSIDRTVAGTLKVHVIHRADNAFAERVLEPLQGAVPPPFTMALDGIAPGDKHNGAVELAPTVQEGIEVVKIDYYIDGEVVHTSQGLGSYTLDASLLDNGSHVVKVVATDIQGREGEVQVPFLVPVLVAPSEGSSLPLVPILSLGVLLAVAYVAIKVGRKRWLEASTPTYSRVDSWASVRTPGTPKGDEWYGDDDAEHPLSRSALTSMPVDETIRGRVVIMDEAAVRGGELETILEFEMKSLPLTFGSGPNADMRVGDAGGLIAAEEARVWVQRGRLVYHKLTTLSAMATEGVTAGWQFLNDGDEMRIGPYRIIFQAQQREVVDEDAQPLPDRLPQEHGMALHRSFGLSESDRNPDLSTWGNEQDSSTSFDDAAIQPEIAEAASWETDSVKGQRVPPSDWGGWQGAASLDQTDDESLDKSVSLEPAEGDLPVPGSWFDEKSETSQPSVWDLSSRPQPESPRDADESGDGELPVWQVESGEAPPNVSGSLTSSEPVEWSPTLLEPKSADWLVEQSEPVDEEMGQIVQPEWGAFVSADDDDGAWEFDTGEEPSERDDEADRAWGT
jgi:VWFA-related protein